MSNSEFDHPIECKKDKHDEPDERSHWENLWARGLKPGEKFDATTLRMSTILTAEQSSPILLKNIDEGKVPKGYALVPGCGRGYDLVALGSDERFVVGLELSSTAVNAAQEYLDNFPEKKNHYKVMEDDFFTHKPESPSGYDFIYDYTFFCAIPISMRDKWAEQMSALLKSGGELWTLVFPEPDESKGKANWNTGPPYPINVQPSIVEKHLKPYPFEMMSREPVPEHLSHPDRGGMETLVKWQKK